jgi:phycobilisome rod-core linker protein
MKIPLQKYKPTTQNIRVRNFGPTDPADENEYTPTSYQIEDSTTSIEQVLRAAYYQVFGEEETLAFNRQKDLELQLQNRQITVREFIRGLAKSEQFYELVVSTNNNYRLVEICFKRLLGRTPYNQDEKIAWSVKTSTLGFHGFIDTIIDSEEYTQAFGDDTVPYQRKRMGGPLFVLETPRYDREYYERELALTGHPDWQFIMEKFPNYQSQQEQAATQVAPDEPNPREDRVSTPKVGDLDVDYLLRKWLP